MSIEKLDVYKHAEQLMFRVYPAIIKFPNAEKYALCQTIKNNFFQLLTYIALGDSVKSKRKSYLQEADGYLQTLKVLFRLAKHQRYIGQEFQKQIDLELTIINKMLSAYIKVS